MPRYGRYPKLLRAAHHHQNLRRRLQKMLHSSQIDALEIHDFAADQVGSIEIPIVALRQFAAQHTNLRTAQSLRVVPILDAHQLHRQRTAAATAGLDSVVPPDVSLAYAQFSMIEQALRRIGVRTQLDPTSHAKRRSHKP